MANLLFMDGEWIFKDLGSGSGTTVNDLPVKESEQVLNPGDLIIIGKHQFKFEPGIGDVTMLGGLSAPKIETPKEKEETPQEKVPEEAADTPEPIAVVAEKPEKAEKKPPEGEPAAQVKKAAPVKKEVKPISSQSATSVPTKKKGGGKVLFGCGGCGCLLTLLLLPAGIFMIAMAKDSHMSELGPFGFILTPIAGVIGVVSLVLIIIAIVKKKKAD